MEKYQNKNIITFLFILIFAGCSTTPEIIKDTKEAGGVEEVKEPGGFKKTGEVKEIKEIIEAEEVGRAEEIKEARESKRVFNKDRDYLEDSKMFFKYGEYEKAMENGLIVYYYITNTSQKEEALYFINESAEEIVQQIDRDLYVKPMSNIKMKIKDLKKKYGVTVELKEIGYQYIVYYDKGYYKKLLKLSPSSKYIKKIELRHMARMGQFVTNPAYRYKQIINVTEKYWKIYNENPGIEYAPDILLKIADLYLYLYEEGINVKKELNLTKKDLDHYYKEAARIYKKVKKEYPNSTAARLIAYVIDSVRLRQDPRTKSKILKRIKAGTLVKIIDRSVKKEAISNMYAYWFKVKLISGLEGWVYGFYLRSNY